MILDSLSRWSFYSSLSPRFDAAFRFLEKHALDPVGRHAIAGDDIYAFIQEEITRLDNGRLLETHRKYIDIHYVIAGRETIQWVPREELSRIAKPYSEETDEEAYPLTPQAAAIPIRPGHFAILFPHDGHLPLCAAGEPGKVNKVVVKVRI